MASSHGTPHPDPNPDPDPDPDPNPKPDPNPIPTAIRYAAANGIVVLKPCQGAPIDTARFPENHENRRGMVDVYGQLSADL